ncbi:Nut Family Member 2G [Manis pentadactyla]|nr:Nut Family Member 2G [Manis pentadactyla]
MPPQREEGDYPDPGLLTYLDELCAQEDFLAKVDIVLHPSFLAELLSPEPELDLLALLRSWSRRKDCPWHR